MTKTTDVFISYAREDRSTATELAEALEARGLNVWWDVDIIAGTQFHEAIQTKINEAKRVIVLWSPHSVASDFVLDEAGRAHQQGKLLPISLDDTSPALGFGALHTLFMKSDALDVNLVVSALNLKTPKPPSPELDGTDTQFSHPIPSRPWWRSLGMYQFLFLGLIAGTVGWFYLFPGEPDTIGGGKLTDRSESFGFEGDGTKPVISVESSGAEDQTAGSGLSERADDLGFLGSPSNQGATSQASPDEVTQEPDGIANAEEIYTGPPIQLTNDYVNAFSKFLSDNGLRRVSAGDLLELGASHSGNGPCAGKNHVPPEELWPNILPAAKALELVKSVTGVEIKVTGAYRNTEYNSCIGGNPLSQHTVFKALDLMSRDLSPEQLAQSFANLREDNHFKGGIGRYNSFIHIDSRGADKDW